MYGFVQKMEFRIQIEQFLSQYIRRLIWNPYRLCYVLPSVEGQKFFQFMQGQGQHMNWEDNDLQEFPLAAQHFIANEEKKNPLQQQQQQQLQEQQEQKYHHNPLGVGPNPNLEDIQRNLTKIVQFIEHIQRNYKRKCRNPIKDLKVYQKIV